MSVQQQMLDDAEDWAHSRGYAQGIEEVLSEVHERNRETFDAIVARFPEWRAIWDSNRRRGER